MQIGETTLSKKKKILYAITPIILVSLIIGIIYPLMIYAFKRIGAKYLGTEVTRELKLWYNREAKNWENESLPLGNGKIGASVFGGVNKEIIQLNEETLWTGGPKEGRKYTFGNDETLENGEYLMKKYFDESRKYLLEGDKKKGKNTAKKIIGVKDDFGAYQSFGQLIFETKKKQIVPIQYKRELDIRKGISTIQYIRGSYPFQREYFVSNPENVLAGQFTTQKSKAYSINIKFNFDQKVDSVAYEDGKLIVVGRIADNDLKYAAVLSVTSSDGKISYVNNEISVDEATDITFIYSIETNYKHEYPTYRQDSSYDVVAKAKANVDNALTKKYETLKKEHILDFQGKMDRLQLDLGQTLPKLPTDKIIRLYQLDCKSRYLEVLLYQYGRYLLLSSSRENSKLPANLQGIWNNSTTPPWNSDYHFNINLQMNYWPAYSANLKETVEPLIAYIEGLVEPGRRTAKIYTGQDVGFMIHTQNNPFGWTAPGWDFEWGWSPASVSWILQNIYEYYEYTGDVDMLKNRIYPLMKEAIQMFNKLMLYDKSNDRYLFAPAYSPEHGDITLGNTYEQSIAWQLYKDTLDSSAIVGETDAEFLTETKNIFNKLKPIEIGKSGQIKEWYEEGKLSLFDRKHRHISHLIGLYPGDLISADNDMYKNAAEYSLKKRGNKTTGWAMAHRLNAWARLNNSKESYILVQKIIKDATLKNLWNSHPPFQIDGNFGFTSGINEMLVQSNQGYIKMLPALPHAWGHGSINGIVARDGIIIDIVWGDMKVDKLNIKTSLNKKIIIDISSFRNKTVTIQNINSNANIEYVEENGKIIFDGVEGGEYTIK